MFVVGCGHFPIFFVSSVLFKRLDRTCFKETKYWRRKLFDFLY